MCMSGPTIKAPLATMKAPLQQALAAKVDRKPPSRVASSKGKKTRKRGTGMSDLVIDGPTNPAGVNSGLGGTYSSSGG